MTEKFILDATAGYRMMWFDKQHPNTIFFDKRLEVNPDMVGNWTELINLPNESMNLIVFDPPQHISKWHKSEYNISKTFYQNVGILEAETWQSDFKKGFAEMWRVLQNKGVLILKWSDHDIDYKKVLALAPVQPLFGQISTQRKTTKTYWFCFIKLALNANQETKGEKP
jgi:hypothetical protein